MMKSRFYFLFAMFTLTTLLPREISGQKSCHSTSKSCETGVSFCSLFYLECMSCRACCGKIMRNERMYETTESESCFSSCGCEEETWHSYTSQLPCGSTNPNGCKTGYFCDTDTFKCDPCVTDICIKETCSASNSCWNSCCKGLCNSQHACAENSYCYNGVCEECPSSCGSWQGACPPECPRTASLSIGNIGFFSVAVVLVVCSCCFCVVNTVRRMYYRRRQRQYQEMLNQPLLVDDDAEIDEGPWDCKSCGHHNRLPTRTCDACGAVRLDKSAFEVEDSDDGERPKLKRDNTIWGWEISGEGAFQWLRRTFTNDGEGDENEEEEEEEKKEEKIEEEVSTKDSDHVVVDVSTSEETTESKTTNSDEDVVDNSRLGGWLWELIEIRRRRRKKKRKKRRRRRRKRRKNKEEEEEDSTESSDSDSSTDSSSSPRIKYIMKWKDASKPVTFQPLPSYVEDVTLKDIAEASKLSLGKKMQWFRKRLASLRIPWDDGHVKIEIRRDSVLSDALGAFENIQIEPRNFHKIFRFEFMGEPAVDAGGVAREFFELAVKHLFRPNFGLFKISRSATYWINEDADMCHPDGEDKKYFQFAGALLGKAVFDGHTTGAYLSRALLKHLLRMPFGVSDLRFVDSSLWDMMTFVRSATEEELDSVCLDFSVTKSNAFGSTVSVDLKPQGSDIAVTRKNRTEFMQLRTKYALMNSISTQLCAFLQGFHSVIPKQLLMVFDSRELELLLCGLPTINVEDWKKHTSYTGTITEKHKVSKWFFEYVSEISQCKQARLLQFITGTSRVPVSGFRALQSYDGKVQRFTLQSCKVKLPRAERKRRKKSHKARAKNYTKKMIRNSSSFLQGSDLENVYVSHLLMPKAHTCFNRLDIPVYLSKEELAAHFELALSSDETVTGFGMD